MKLKLPNSDDKPVFKEGSLVEVSSDVDGFTGVWYAATVLESPLTPSPPNKSSKKGRFFLVEYQTLLRDDGSEKALSEYVEPSFVRPLPPNDEHDLQVNDVVDAMYLDGWWIGVIVKVNQESNIYSVYFENPPDLLHFGRHDLRAHWDWKGGKWIRPQKQEVKDVFDAVEHEERFPFSGTAYPEETDLVATCSRKSRLDWSSRSTENSSGKEMKEAGLSFDTSDNFTLKKLKLKQIAKKRGRPVKRKRGEQEKTLVKGKKRDGFSDTVDIIVLKGYDSPDAESPINIGESKRAKHDGARDNVDKLVLKDHEIVDAESPVNTGESKRTKHDGAEDAVDKLVSRDFEIADAESAGNMEESKVRKHDGAGSSVDKFFFKDHAIDAELARNIGDAEGTKNEGARGDVNNMILKYPVIIDAESPRNTAESKGKRRDESGGSVDKIVLKDNYMAYSKSPVNTEESKLTKHVMIDVQSPRNTEESEGTNHDGAAAAVDKMALKYPAIFDAESPKITEESEGFEDASPEKAANVSDTGCSTREAETAIVELPGDMDTFAKPISMCFDGLSSRKIVIHSKFLCAKTVNQNQRNNAKGKLIEIVNESAANDSVSDRIRDENQCFSFVEPSSMWKTFIQSVEVLETMPQKPHFHPLRQCKEMYRDGLAFGYMITFAKVVKRTSELQVNDPKSVFNSISETLQDIELHGFDVQPIRHRLTELQLMKQRQEQLQEASKEFEHQILERTHEQMKVSTKLAEVVEEMKLLEEKKRKIMLLMQENDSKITELKSNFDVCTEDIQNAQLDFESLAAAPW